MILTILNEYIDGIINDMNSRYDMNLKAVKSEFIDEDYINIPASRSVNAYQVIVDEYHLTDEIESRISSYATARIEFSFVMSAKKYTDYENYVNRYLFEIVSLINKSFMYYVPESTAGIILNGINSVSLSNGGRVKNNYYMPTINFNCEYISEYSEFTNTSDNYLS